MKMDYPHWVCLVTLPRAILSKGFREFNEYDVYFGERTYSGKISTFCACMRDGVSLLALSNRSPRCWRHWDVSEVSFTEWQLLNASSPSDRVTCRVCMPTRRERGENAARTGLQKMDAACTALQLLKLAFLPPVSTLCSTFHYIRGFTTYIHV